MTTAAFTTVKKNKNKWTVGEKKTCLQHQISDQELIED